MATFFTERISPLILNALVSKDVGVIEDIAEISAVGHRIVHGGKEFTGSVIIDDKVPTEQVVSALERTRQ